jgi:dipeptidase D
VGNVLIKKKACPGMEDRKTVILQGHLDMVHQKNNDTIFDFDNQGIDMYIDGEWVKAKGTTLGADNGLGVAAIMAVLASKDIPHPNIEALFTIDEETGMTGALGLKAGWLTGEILLNLDTEEDDEIDIGCAGGMDVTATGTYLNIPVPNDFTGISIELKGLQGGHSGMDIHKGLGNANKIMNRLLLCAANNGAHIHCIEGGSLRNAIPRESKALLAIKQDLCDAAIGEISTIKKDILAEYSFLEPNIQINVAKAEKPETMMDEHWKTLNAIYCAHNGVFRMSPNIQDLVEASNNLARVEIKDGNIKILCLSRSSVDSSKRDVVQALKSSFELAGLKVNTSGEYPGWTPNPNSPILRVMTSIYENKFGSKPHVVACHAGLECGIIGKNYPGLDMISFGPTIKGAHSPDERANIPSSQKFWSFFLDVLKSIPKK